MTASGSHRRFGVGAAALALLLTADARSAPGDALRPGAPSAAQLRTAAEAAEAAGDWEAASAAYCQLYLSDRAAPGVRDRLQNALRRHQQARRHRDPGFRQFAEGLAAPDALALYAEVVDLVPGAYADPGRATPQRLWAAGVEEFDRALGSPAFRQAYLPGADPRAVEEFRGTLRRVWARRAVADPASARVALRQVIGAAQEAFGVRVPAAVALEFVGGACAGLDEYTVFLAPAAPDRPPADLSPYGVYLAAQDGGLVVAGVLPGSWAALNAPVRKGDRVLRLNGRSLEMAGPGAVAAALQAAADGVHVLETTAPADFEPVVTRLPAAVPTVYGYPADRVPTPLLGPDAGVGYLKVGAFHAATPRELEAAVAALRDRGTRVLILDLRGNHGGSFLAGVDVARRLLPGGVIVSTRGQLGRANAVFTSDTGAGAIDVPLVVLIDAETASAAEVVAAALKDNGRATLVGTPSFGKGAVQYPFKLVALDDPAGRPRSGTVRLTVARLLTPAGAPIHGVGVAPHVVVADPDLQLEIAIQKALDLAPARPMMP